jgi:hypothetical protein
MQIFGMQRHGRRLLFCSLCAFLLVWSATAQEPEIGIDPAPDEGAPESVDPEPEAGAKDDQSAPPISPRVPETDLEAEMREIFRRVEIKLRDIDVLLTDAGAGDTSRLSEVGESGIDELLRRSIEEGRAVQREMQQLLQLAQQAGSSSSSSGGSSSSQQSSQGQSGQEPSPLDQGPGRQRSQEATPTLPEQQQPGGEQPGEQPGEKPGGEQEGEQPGGQNPKPGEGEQPDGGPERPDDDPQNAEGNDPKQDETAAPSQRGDLSERWGELPVHVRDVFRTEGGEDMPAEYRDWIDAYYRRLNERAAQGR